MRMSVLAIIAACIFICLGVVLYYDTGTESNIDTINRQYRIYLATACQSAIDSAQNMKHLGGTIFSTPESREAAVNSFFKSLELSFNRTGIYAEEIKSYVPVILLIDTDGFYIWDSATVDESLPDKEKITKDSDAIKKVLEHYINSKNEYQKYGISYGVSFDSISDSEWEELLGTPTVLAFLQGIQVQKMSGTEILNVYAFAGTQIIEKLHYFIDVNNKYHCLENLIKSGDVKLIDGNYYYEGNRISNIFSSMEECARRGAYPALIN